MGQIVSAPRAGCGRRRRRDARDDRQEPGSAAGRKTGTGPEMTTGKNTGGDQPGGRKRPMKPRQWERDTIQKERGESPKSRRSRQPSTNVGPFRILILRQGQQDGDNIEAGYGL